MNTKCARDIMTCPAVTVGPEQPLTDTIRLLLRHHISGAPVVGEDGKLVGIITEHDIMNFALSGNAADTTVSEAMTRSPVSFPPDAKLSVILESLKSKRIRRVPIVENQRVVGIVSRRDVLREMLFLYSQY